MGSVACNGDNHICTECGETEEIVCLDDLTESQIDELLNE
jgi:hypothetical protein